jgi:amphi-Trp domain-containing protein
MQAKPDRDEERVLTARQFAEALRRVADALDAGDRIEVRVRGERVHVPARATFSIEHEREGDDEELEFQLRWKKG